MRNFLLAIVFVGILGGCAPIMWDKPGVNQQQFAQDDARCKLIAKGMNSGEFYAEGKPAFVAGAAAGNAIGTAIATRADYKNCMIAAGYTEQSPQLQAAASKLRPVVAEMTACVTAIYNAPDAEPIRRHMPFNGQQATPEQIADTGLATEQEIASVNLLRPKYRECQQATIQASSTAAPAIVPALQTALAESEGDIAALVARKMTWGEFNTRRRDRGLRVQQQINAELQRQG